MGYRCRLPRKTLFVDIPFTLTLRDPLPWGSPASSPPLYPRFPGQTMPTDKFEALKFSMPSSPKLYLLISMRAAGHHPITMASSSDKKNDAPALHTTSRRLPASTAYSQHQGDSRINATRCIDATPLISTKQRRSPVRNLSMNTSSQSGISCSKPSRTSIIEKSPLRNRSSKRWSASVSGASLSKSGLRINVRYRAWARRQASTLA